LEANRDWCVEWLPTLAQSFNTQLFIKEKDEDDDNNSEEDEKNEKKVWFILPDTKEVELCKEDWKGQRYRNSALFTSIEAVTEYYFTSSSTTSNTSNNSNKDNKDNDGYSKPWGSTIANFANQLVKGNKDKDDNNNKDGNKDDNSSPSSLIPSSGLLGDENSLDTLATKEAAALHLVCQPGNGGKLPVLLYLFLKFLLHMHNVYRKKT
jgi:ABC-type antimicrobial peptide transport system permease subunit